MESFPPNAKTGSIVSKGLRYIYVANLNIIIEQQVASCTPKILHQEDFNTDILSENFQKLLKSLVFKAHLMVGPF